MEIDPREGDGCGAAIVATGLGPGPTTGPAPSCGKPKASGGNWFVAGRSWGEACGAANFLEGRRPGLGKAARFERDVRRLPFNIGRRS